MDAPPDGCHATAHLWRSSLRVVERTSIPTREVFAYWIGCGTLHRIERKHLKAVYARFDAAMLRALAEAAGEYAHDPAAIRRYVFTLREAETKT